MAPPAKKRVQSSAKKESSSKKERTPKAMVVPTEGHSPPSKEYELKKKVSSFVDSPTLKLFDHRFVKQDCFFSKANKLKLEVVTSIAHTFAEPETIDEAFDIPPEDTSKFRLLRMDYTAVPLLFRSPSRPSLEWKSWVSSELEDLGAKDLLRRAGVLSALTSTTQLGIFRDIRGLRHVVRRWNKTTHTFVCSWGEFTPTLEDVSKLLRLPVMGDMSPFSIELTEQEVQTELTLLEGLSLCRLLENKRQSSRPSFACWIRYFWGTMEKETFCPGAGYDKGCRLEALVCLWLCKFVFPELQGDVIQRHMFPLAIKIARGVRFPLAPVFLGTFYKHLDMILEDEILAGGKYAIDTELAINFLQVFLWERIRKYAGEPTSSKTVMYELGTNSDVPLWSRWFHMKYTKASIWFLMDDIDSFTFRPYVGLENEFASTTRSKDKDTRNSTTSEIVKVPMCDPDGNWADLEYVVGIRPGLLPACIGTEIFSVNYWPHRVLRQFGLDQGVPRLYSFSEEDVLKSPSFGVSRFISSSLKSLPTIRSLTIQIAGSERQGLYTPKFVTYWKKTINDFSQFIKGPKSVCEALPTNLVPKRLRLDTREVRSFCTKIGMPFTVIDGPQREVVGAVRTGRKVVNPDEDVPLVEMLSRSSPTEDNELAQSQAQVTTSDTPAKKRSAGKSKSATPKRKSARLLLKSLSSDNMETKENVNGEDGAEESHGKEINHDGLVVSEGDALPVLQVVENGKESVSTEEEIKKLKFEADNNINNNNNNNNNSASVAVIKSTKTNYKKRKSLPLAMVSCSNNMNGSAVGDSQVSHIQTAVPIAKRLRENSSGSQGSETTEGGSKRGESSNKAASASVSASEGAIAATVTVAEAVGDSGWQSKLNQFLGAFYGNAVAPHSIEDFLNLSGRTKVLNGIAIPEESYDSMMNAMAVHGDFVANCWASRPVRDIMFSRLSLVFFSLEQIPLSKLSEDTVLSLRDVVREATAVGFGVDFLLDHTRKLVSALFGRRIYFDTLTTLDAQIEGAQAAFEAAKAKLDGLKKSRSEVVARASVSSGTEGDCIRQALEFSTSLIHGLS